MLTLTIYFYIGFLYTLSYAEICTDNDRCSPPYCQEMKRSDIEKHLSTKTPYRAIANFDDKPRVYEGNIKKKIILWIIFIFH